MQFSKRACPGFGGLVGSPLTTLPWLEYKLAKKKLKRIDDSRVDEFFVLLAGNLERIDVAFQARAALIFKHCQLPRALSFLRSQCKSGGRGTAWMHDAMARVSCHGLSQQAALRLAEIARHIEAWAQLNAVGLRKIMKKFEKRFPAASAASIAFKQEQHQSRAFLQGPLVMELRSCCLLSDPVVRPQLASVMSLSPEVVPMSCPVCFDVFVDPLGLPCGHCICGRCHDRLKATTTAVCPVCRLPCGKAAVAMPHLSELVRTELRGEYTELKKELKAEDLVRRIEHERQLRALPANAQFMISALSSI